MLFFRGDPFFIEGTLRVAFFFEHLNSTDGNAFFALDLNEKKLHEIGPNNSIVIALPGAEEFVSVCQERYLPLGDGKRSVNCLFLDRWNAKLERTRYAKAQVSVYYGGSFYDSRRPQRVTYIPGEERPLPAGEESPEGSARP